MGTQIDLVKILTKRKNQQNLPPCSPLSHDADGLLHFPSSCGPAHLCSFTPPICASSSKVAREEPGFKGRAVNLNFCTGSQTLW
eukprot:scaffold11072_cov10-Tisochrysis_lutea.AAC.1